MSHQDRVPLLTITHPSWYVVPLAYVRDTLASTEVEIQTDVDVDVYVHIGFDVLLLCLVDLLGSCTYLHSVIVILGANSLMTLGPK